MLPSDVYSWILSRVWYDLHALQDDTTALLDFRHEMLCRLKLVGETALENTDPLLEKLTTSRQTIEVNYC